MLIRFNCSLFRDIGDFIASFAGIGIIRVIGIRHLLALGRLAQVLLLYCSVPYLRACARECGSICQALPFVVNVSFFTVLRRDRFPAVAGQSQQLKKAARAEGTRVLESTLRHGSGSRSCS